MALFSKNVVDLGLNEVDLVTRDKVVEEIINGIPESKIKETYGITSSELSIIVENIVDQITDKNRATSTERHYSNFLLEHLKELKILDFAVQQLKNSGNYSSIPNAVKLRSELREKAMKMGVDLKIIKVAPKEEMIETYELKGEFSQLSNDDIIKAIVSNTASMSKLLDKYGFDGVLDLDISKVHFATTEEQAEHEKSQKPKTIVTGLQKITKKTTKD